MPTTVDRSRGRQGVRSGAQGAVGEHLSKVMTALITGLVVIAFALVMTKPGQDIDAATQHFMLFYAGVFALIGLTASVGVGLVATDRIVMTPGHRVMAQAVHRAVSFGALAFLVIHIVTEILAQRAHVIDAFIPFLSPYRTFYIGLGTIASDLILLIVVTSIWRKRFTAHGKAWRWRAIHYTSYVAFVFGVLHGLLGGRAAKPYVDWSYGFAIALTALAVVVRFLAISLRSKDKVSAPPRRGPGGRRPGLLGDLAAAVRRAEHGSGSAERDHPDAAHRGGSAGIRPRPAGQPGLGRAAARARLGRVLGPAARTARRGRLRRGPFAHAPGRAGVRGVRDRRDRELSVPGRARQAAPVRAGIRRPAAFPGSAEETRAPGRPVVLSVRRAGPSAGPG